MTELSQDAVRGLLVAAQGLQQPSKPRPATQKSVQDIIRQMHVLQIDTISVVARSPYLVLWSRLGDYDPKWLETLLEQGKLFEYWSHAACFLPIEDFEYYRLAMTRGGSEGGWQRWLNENRDVAHTVINHVREKGAVRSSDFERQDGQKGSWWNWKAEKVALEYLFNAGDLMIRKRHNFQRIYDLTERVLPDWDDSRMATQERRHDYFVLNTVKALGVTKAEWIADYFRLKQADVRASLKRLEKGGQLRQVKVEGWDALAYYHADHETLVNAAAKGKVPQSKTTLLSPFDPFVWDRKRALALYNFDYRIECYTPAPKRIYGYFTLPILYKNQVIGRLDPKAHRKDGFFEIKALHLEPWVQVDDDLIASIKGAINACAVWHKTPEVAVRWANVPGLADALA